MAGNCRYIGQFTCSEQAGLAGYKVCQWNGGDLNNYHWSQFVSCGKDKVCDSNARSTKKICQPKPKDDDRPIPVGGADCDQFHIGKFTCGDLLGQAYYKICLCQISLDGTTCSWTAPFSCGRGNTCDARAGDVRRACMEPESIERPQGQNQPNPMSLILPLILDEDKEGQ